MMHRRPTLHRTLIALAAAVAAPAMCLAQQAGLEATGSWYRPHTNTAYLYVRNTTDKAVKLADLQVNDYAETAVPWPLDPNRKSHWFDIVPAVVQAGGVGQVRVNLREAAGDGGVKISVAAEGVDRVSGTIANAEPTLSFSDITFAKDGSTATLFVAGTNAKITRVLMDGRDVTAECDLRGSESFQGTAIVTVKPAKAFIRGAYHVFETYAADGRVARYAAHAIWNDLILGTYGNVEHFSAYQENGLNNYTSFRNIAPELMQQLKALGIKAAPVPFVGGQWSVKKKEWTPFDEAKTRANLEALKANADSVAFYTASDEPDGYDSAAKTLGMHGRILVHQRQLTEEIDPGAATFVQIDNSLRPKNYHVYSELMDYSATHRYNLGQEFLAGDREATTQSRKSGSPRPYLWVTQLYPVREREGERVAYNGRHPLPQEMEMQMLETLANGAKGVIHYIHSGSTGGRGGSGLDKPLWDSMKPTHQQLAAVGPLVVRSTPTTWASANNDKVRTVALLSGTSDVLLVVTNQAVVSTKTAFDVPPQENVAVTLALPAWMTLTAAEQIVAGGEKKPLPVQNQDGQLTITLPRLEVGTLVWLHGGQQK